MTTTTVLIGTTARDLPTMCGRGITEGETVRVTESAGGMFRIVAPGGRVNGYRTWDQLIDVVDPA